MTKGWFNTSQTKYRYIISSIYVSCSNTTIQKLVVIYIWRHAEDKYSVGVFSLRSTALLKHFGRGKTMSSKSAVSFFGALHTVVLVLWFCWQLLPLSLWLQYQHNSRELVAAVRVCGFILRSVSGLLSQLILISLRWKSWLPCCCLGLPFPVYVKLLISFHLYLMSLLPQP